jgi:hypothetical protein
MEYGAFLEARRRAMAKVVRDAFERLGTRRAGGSLKLHRVKARS